MARFVLLGTGRLSAMSSQSELPLTSPAYNSLVLQLVDACHHWQ